MKDFQVWELKGFGFENLVQGKRNLKGPGRGEVLLRMKAASLNYRDILTVKGLYNPRQTFPLVPLSDGVGIVEEIGPGVKNLRPGRRVCPIFAQAWISGPITRDAVRSTLGGPLDGTLTQYMILKEEGLVIVPGYLTDEEAACLPCAQLTAWSALFEHGDLKPGHSLLIMGTGGVSISALQFATAIGARTYAITSSREKAEALRKMGVLEVVNYKENPEWGKAIKALSDGGVDHVVEVGGAGTLTQSLKAVKPGGTVSLIGVLSGLSSEFDVIPVLMNQIRIQGIFVGSREMFERMNKALESYEIRPLVNKVFDFSNARDALEYLDSRRHFGKVCIRID